MEDFKFYNLKEVGEILKVTIRTLYRYIDSGKLEANKIGGKWIVTEENLKKFIEGKK